MTRPKLKDRIRQGTLLLDGAMGTQLFARGVEPGTCNDALNLDAPDIVRAVHDAYLQAGSSAVITNTFGANRLTLLRHGHDARAYEISNAGAKVARDAAGDDRYVLGDIGPTGDFLKPLGTLEPETLKEVFELQAQGLLNGGVDGFIVETMTALDELEVAIEAAQSVAGEVPVFASMSFDKGAAGFRTMMGVDVPAAIQKMLSLGVDAVGFNCGTATLDEYVDLAGEYVAAVRSAGEDAAIFAEPNAGKPELVDGQAIYRVTPDEFADAAEKILAGGIHVLGGCCGTTPEFIKAVTSRVTD
jgi:methionine synthase I (cobalamin-dependent)